MRIFSYRIPFHLVLSQELFRWRDSPNLSLLGRRVICGISLVGLQALAVLEAIYSIGLAIFPIGKRSFEERKYCLFDAGANIGISLVIFSLLQKDNLVKACISKSSS